MTETGAILRATALGLAGLLAACAPAPPVVPIPEIGGAAGENPALARFYAGVEARLLSQGMLRTDGLNAPIPLDADTVAQNFERIALYDEYVVRGGRFIAQQTPSRLRRWDRPIRVRVVHGAGATPDRIAADTGNVTAYLDRIGRLTGIDIRPTSGKANFMVMFLGANETAAAAPILNAAFPGLGSEVTREITTPPRETFCAAYALSDNTTASTYSAAIVLIKAEHTDLMRLSCIHEEIAQAMGLANDSPVARPSIFNDDEEFALLTRQDEILLQLLYDPALRPGMTPDDARPILRGLAAGYLARAGIAGS